MFIAKHKFLSYAVFLLAAVFGYLEVFRVEMTNDTNYYMHCALLLWRFGTHQLYERCADENFPFHIILYAPLAALAAYTHINAAYVLHGFCVVMCAVSLITLSSSLKAHGISEHDRHIWLAGVAFAILIAPSIYGVFADREHFLFILGLPWMIQMVLRLKPANYTCVLAAFGFCMKPHDAFFFAMMALFAGPAEWSLKKRLFSTSSLIIAGIGAAYFELIFYLFPNFITDILPLAAFAYTSRYYTIEYKINFAIKYYILAAASICMFVRPAISIIPWFAFVIGGAIPFYLNAGWDYTFYLNFVPMFLCLITPWLEQYRHADGVTRDLKNPKKVLKLLIGGIFIICIFSIGCEMRLLRPVHFLNHNDMDPNMREEMQKDAGDKIIVLSPNLWNTLVEPFNGKPEAVFGYDNLWTYRWLAENANNPHYHEILHHLISSFLKAITDNPKAVLFIDYSPRPVITDDGILGFLMRDPEIHAAMQKYKIVKTIDYCHNSDEISCRFVELKRQDDELH